MAPHQGPRRRRRPGRGAATAAATTAFSSLLLLVGGAQGSRGHALGGKKQTEAGFLHYASCTSSISPSPFSSFSPPPSSSSPPSSYAVFVSTFSLRVNPLLARGWGPGSGSSSAGSGSGSGSGNRGRNMDDDADDIARELSVLEAEQARLMAELEAARLKAQLAKLQQQQAERGGGEGGGGGGGGGGRSRSNSSSGGKRRGSRDNKSDDNQKNNEELQENAPRPPVSSRTGLQAAVPLSAKGPAGKKKAVVERGWGGPTEGRGGSMTSRATPSLPSAPGGGGEGGGKGGALTDLGQEERYAEVVEELVSALQDVSKDSGVDIKTIDLDREGEGEGGSGLERLAAWGALVEKTITSSKYLLTADKVLGMKHLADRLLPPEDFHGADITVAHLAVIRAVTQGIADEYPEVRRRRGNMLYVLLNLPWASRGMGNVHQHAEEVAMGSGISMESSLGLGCRAVFECTMSECLPGSSEALSLMKAEVFRGTTRALMEFGGLARQVLGLTKMPTEEAVKGAAFFLVPWLRRVAKRALEGEGGGKESEVSKEEGVARLGMVMELGRYAAESLALARGLNPAQDPDAFEEGVQGVLAEKVNGIGVELSSSIRSSLLGGYVRQWVLECMLHRSLPVPWEDGEGRLRAGDIGGWDLARQVLSLSEMQLLYVAKETVPVVVGEMMAEVWGERGGEWPGGGVGFQRDWGRVCRRLKYDKYEGGTARTKAVRVMAEKVVEGGREGGKEGGNADQRRELAITWGCETLELGREEFEAMAEDQGTFELQTLVLEGMLGPGGLSAEEVVERIVGEGARMRLDGGSVRRATTAAVQVHIGNLAARALFADMEGQPQKAFKEIESTLRFIQTDAELFRKKLGCEINPTARIADEDGLQLANVCTKMISRRQAPEAARAFLDIIGYSDRVGM
ncbi:Hypothetical protein NocV09_01501790 [Nannochloropsis oceanica]